MKRCLVLAVVIVIVLAMASLCFGEDVLMKGKIIDVEMKISKNGNEYTIITLPEKREMEGIEYEADARIFAFGKMHEAAKVLTVGQEIRLVVKKGKYRGEDSLTLLHVVPEKKVK